jgi:hypothetical protein
VSEGFDAFPENQTPAGPSLRGFFISSFTMRTYDKLIATISARRSVAPVRAGSGRNQHQRR